MAPPNSSESQGYSPEELAHPTLDFEPVAVNGANGEHLRRAHLVPLASRRPQRTRARIESVPTVLVDQSGLFRAGLRHILSGSRFRVTMDCSSIHDIEPDAFGRVASV